MSDGEIVDKAELPLPPKLFDSAGTLQDEFAHLRTIETTAITYLSDGLKVKGYCLKPAGPGPFPCVIYNRGGNREFGSIGEPVLFNLLGRIASWGYFVAASQYRGGCGSEGRDEFGGADLGDVLNLLPLLDGESCADSSRIGMYGASRGGMMSYLALTRTDRIRAAVIRCGVSDLTNWDEDRKDMEQVYRDLIPDFELDREAALRRRSAVHWVDKLCPSTPILIMQGGSDWRVNPRSALRMGEALLDAGHPFRLSMLEGADHALTEAMPERNRLTREWFDRFVLGDGPLPDMRPHGD